MNGDIDVISEELSYLANPEYGCIDLFYKEERVTTWAYDDDADAAFLEFREVFLSGAKAILAQLEKGK